MNRDSCAQSSGDDSVKNWLRWEIVVLAIVVVVAFFLKEYSIRFYDVMSADGTGYATLGKNFFDTFDPASFGAGFPPLYPFFIGLFNLMFDDLDKAARTVSVFFHILTVLPIYLIAREFHGRISAAIAVMLYLSLPFLQGMAGVDIAEPTYTFFVFCGAYVSWRGFQDRRQLFMFIAGFFLAMAYLARPEGFVLLVALSVLYPLISVKRFSGQVPKLLILLFTFWLGFFVFAAPYLLLLHKLTGEWQLSGKTTVVSSAIKEYMGKTIGDERLLLDGKGEFLKQKGSLGDFILKEPDLFVKNVLNNLQKLPSELSGAIPLYLWPLVFIGFLAYPWKGRHLQQKLFLLFFTSPIVLYVVFFVVGRYLYPYIPIFLILAAAGAMKVASFLPERPRLAVVSLATTIVIVHFVYVVYPRPKPPYSYEQDGGRFDDKQVGLRLKTLLPEKAVIMTRSGRVSFYSERPFILPPQASMEEILQYARKNKVTHIVANMQLMQMRPQLESLYEPLFGVAASVPPPGLELVYMGQEPGGLPYLVYRLVGK